MNRYPFWKYLVVVLAILGGFLYTLPNFYGQTPAVRVVFSQSSNAATSELIDGLQQQVEKILKEGAIAGFSIVRDERGLSVLLSGEDKQVLAKKALERGLLGEGTNRTEQYTIALGASSNSPGWLTAIRALPMYLGLDLRGGVHLLYQVDMGQAITKRLDSVVGEMRVLLRDRNIRHLGIERRSESITIKLRNVEQEVVLRNLMMDSFPDLLLNEPRKEGDTTVFSLSLRPEANLRVRENAIRQNILTFNKRVNAMGVAEPVIQQQGAERIVVQLPGVQDPAAVKEILGRTASLELRMVCESPDEMIAMRAGQVPLNCELYQERGGVPVLVRKRVELTGERLTDAQPGFDSQTREPVVNLSLDSSGARLFKDLTRDNVGRRLAILLVEKGRGEVVTAPVIRSEIGGGRVQISGSMNTAEANQVSILLRSGALAAPMEIVEERTVGPSLGRENIDRGVNSTLIGFAMIAVFMSLYYMFFGIISVVALAVNLLFLVGLLSLLQATLTLPGMAAIALTLGMAIDANVLINERIREELRLGATPQVAIMTGYERAFGTILDSNITTLIAGLALLIFGSGPVRGFAVVHCLGILTSIFSSVVVSRGLVNLLYGYRHRVSQLSIGQIWRPSGNTAVSGIAP